jgi:hypothetical protein
VTLHYVLMTVVWSPTTGRNSRNKGTIKYDILFLNVFDTIFKLNFWLLSGVRLPWDISLESLVNNQLSLTSPWSRDILDRGNSHTLNRSADYQKYTSLFCFYACFYEILDYSLTKAPFFTRGIPHICRKVFLYIFIINFKISLCSIFFQAWFWWLYIRVVCPMAWY